MLVDTHAHLDFTDDIDGWLDRAKKNGVEKIICVGTSVEASKRCLEIAQRYSTDDLQIYATVGIHAQDGEGDVEKYGSLEKCTYELRKILDRVENDNTKVVAIGECGFDFYLPEEKRIPTVDKQSLRSSSSQDSTASLKDKQFQRELFEAQIELAIDLNLPLVIHCRNAFAETFEILHGYSSSATRSYLNNSNNVSKGRFSPASAGSNNNLRGLFHSWTGDWEAAQRALSLGFYISFSGIVTFKNAPTVQEVAKKIPLGRMLLETDSPFLAPEPVRGSRNEPKNVRMIAQFIARLRNIPVDKVERVTSENAGRLFRI